MTRPSAQPPVRTTWWDDLQARMFAPVDAASLAVFRVLFGLLMAWEVLRYFQLGWITRNYVAPSFYFTYFGFEWVKPWPGLGMYLHFLALGILACMVAAGAFHRASVALFFLGFSYVFLLDQSQYLNHFYLICLVSFLLMVVPAHRTWSVDAWRRPDRASDSVPAWSVWLVKAQLGLVYVFAGLAKVNADWLRGEPLRMWLAAETDFPVIGRYFTEDWMVYLFSYGGLLLDLAIAPLLFFKRTRLPAFVAVLGFHLMNSQLFNIGVFPWFMIAASLVFFPPDWPRRFLRRAAAARPPLAVPKPGHQRLLLAGLGLYLAVQVVLPLRHWAYPGNVSWTEQGHRFAWHMKLRSKQGEVIFHVTRKANGKTVHVDPRTELTARQAAKMATHPDMILQFAHHLAEVARQKGLGEVEVRVSSMVALNGRRPQPLIDPRVDLVKVRRSLLPAPWIVPLTEPFQWRKLPQAQAGEADLDAE